MIRRLTFPQIWWLLSFVALDGVVAAASLFVVVFIRRQVSLPGTESLLPAGKFPLDLENFAVVVVSLIIGLALSGFYDWQRSSRHRPFLSAALIIQLVLIAMGAVLLARPYPRSVLLFVPIIEAILLPLSRRFCERWIRVKSPEAVLVGDIARIDALLGKIITHRESRIHVIGVVSDSPGQGSDQLHWGSIEDPSVRERIAEADEVIYLPGRETDLRLRLLEIRGAEGYLLLPTHQEALLSSGRFTWLADQPLVEVSARSAYGMGSFLKRLADLVLAVTFLVVTLPAWIVIGIALALDDGFPLTLRQKRAGRNGRTFDLWKFRSIRRGMESLELVQEGDQRVTKVGSWLRRHRLDEMPQLLNVITGDMSLVGPRPERPEITDRIDAEVPGFRLRTIVRPGLAGLAQVCGDYHTDAETKLVYDLRYITTWSLALDLRILLTAIPTALSGRGL